MKRILLLIAIFLSFAPNVLAQAHDSSAISIKPGAMELGLDGSMTIVEGSSRTTLAIRAGFFTMAPRGLFGFETSLSYSHLNALDWLDMEGALSWQTKFGNSTVYPFLALGGGFRHEWLGSFRQIRYPLGLNSGIRALVASQAAFRAEYKFRRILHDPVENFSEHQIVIGISILLKN
ncbi:MAG: hypothetical protein ONB46_06850 [candidate division KSB1 bacterium]|nr:hypothetical protein [candidate division KSB1 bacterium]MDZ7367178.1 hypothetical protein [candidate division KSB1 bacterium]MDZ7405339.1 hypothetical protein [candidate division KSB1 bacterium]